MPQLAAYTRIHIGQVPKILAAAIPKKRLFRKPMYELESFLESQIEHIIVGQVDGDTIIATGLIIENILGHNIFQSGENDLDAIAKSLSRKGGSYWFLTKNHSSVFKKVTGKSLNQSIVSDFCKENPDFQVNIEDVKKAIQIFNESLEEISNNEVILWSVG